MTEQDLGKEDIRHLSVPDKLRYLRDNFSDEIPDQVIHSTSPNNAFKVRRNWFQGVVATLERALDEGLVSNPDMEWRVNVFIRDYTSQEFKDKPLTEASDIDEANRIINLVLGEEHTVELDLLEKIHKENVKKGLELKESVTRTFDSPSYRRAIGVALFGQDKKVTTGPDGEIIEEDWSLEDIDRESDRLGEEQELHLRDEMARGLRLSIESLMEFFTTTEHPLLKTSNTNIDCILALTERFLASDAEMFEDWPVMITRARKQSEVLEGVRQLILKPVTSFYEHIEMNDDVWELQTDEMRGESGRDIEKWRELEKKRIEQGLPDCEEEEWVKVLLRVDSHLTQYIQDFVQETAEDRKSTISLASGLTKGGEKVVGQRALDSWQKEADELAEFSQKLLFARNLTEVLALIKSKYGEEADFRSFFQQLDPMEQLLGPESQTESDSQ